MFPVVPAARWCFGALALLALSGGRAEAAIDVAAAKRTFAEAQAICDRDKALFWGKPLCGPIMLVDPNDRQIVTNVADAGGALKGQDGVFVGVLPPSEPISNTAVSWSGTRWTQLMWPLPEDEATRHAMLAHEMFHRIQAELGLTRNDIGNAHLDEAEGRYLLRLEARALAAALQAKTDAARRTALSDALLFRRARYAAFPNAAVEEARLEVNEGVPEYTGVRLGLTTPAARVAYAVKDLESLDAMPSYVRGFAYATGPAYGLLLDRANESWRARLADQRFDQLLQAAYKLPEPSLLDAAQRMPAYDAGGALRMAEEKRHAEREALRASYRARLVDGPVLVLPAQKANRQFRPRELLALPPLGTVYPTLRLASEWGVLEVEADGALLSRDQKATVSAEGLTAEARQGKGWKLTLKDGWRLVPGPRPGDFTVTPAAP